MMPRYKQALTATTLFLISTSVVLADDFNPFFEVLVMGGFATADAQDSTVELNEVETDSLVQTNDGDWKYWTGQLGLGYVFQLTDDIKTGEVEWFPRINPQINVYFLGGDNIEGDVYQFQEAEFDNLDYTMNFDSTRLMFDLGLTIASIEQFSIYAIAGAGVAWNKLDLVTTPNQSGIDCGAQGFEIPSEQSTSFAYEFGAGLSYAVLEDVSISIEYLYTGFTDVSLGDYSDSTFDIQGSDVDINTQAILLGARIAL